jgi:hypothetical protein
MPRLRYGGAAYEETDNGLETVAGRGAQLEMDDLYDALSVQAEWIPTFAAMTALAMDLLLRGKAP